MQQERIQKQMKKNNFDEVFALATEFDQLARDIDPYEYEDTVQDCEENVREVAEAILNGDLAPFEAFLQESIDEGAEDVCEEQAKELLAKLAEYKASIGS